MRIRALVLAGAVMASGGMQMMGQMSGPPPSPPIGTKEDPAKAVDGLLSLMEMQVVGGERLMQLPAAVLTEAASSLDQRLE